MTFFSHRFHYSWIILAMGTMVVFGSLGLGRFGYTAVLPAMRADLEMDNTQTGMLATANLIGYLILSVIGGAMASLYGPRVVITGGLALAGISMLFTGLVNGFLPAAIWRALTGIGSGASNVPMMALLSAWFVPRRRGLAAGIVVAGSSLALICIGPLVPLSVYYESGWRICWFIFGGATLLLAIGSFLLLRNRPAEMGLKPFSGRRVRGIRRWTVLCLPSLPRSLAPSLPCFPLGADKEDFVSGSRPQGLQWGSVYRSAKVWHLGLIYVAFGFSYIIYMTFFIEHLIVEGGYSQGAAGRLFMTIGWFSLACGLIWGTVSDVIGRKGALTIVYLIHTLSFSLFALWSSPLSFTFSAILFGLSAWSIPAIMAAACGDILGARLVPAALGFITLLFGIGQAVGTSIAGIMADVANSFSPAFLLASGIAFLGALGSLLLRPTPSQSE